MAYACASLPPGSRGLGYVALHLWLSALMIGAWATGGPSESDQRWTVAAGVLARLLLLLAPSFTTHDVQRYLWDGRVLLEGLDPYRIPAGAPELAALRQTWPTPSEHLAYPTLYPPGALFLFSALALLGPSGGAWAWKLVATLASVATVLVCWRLARERGQARHLSLVALSPLLLLEAGVGAHVDVLAGLFVSCALLLFQRRSHLWSGAAIGAAALVKLFPLSLVLPLALASEGRQRWRLLGAAALVFGAGYAAPLSLGILPPGSLPMFLERWRFGSPVFSLLSAALGVHGLYVAGALVVLGLAAVASWGRRQAWPSRASAALALPVALSPVVFPWYLASLVPTLAAAPSAVWVAWATAAPLTYEVIDQFDARGTWEPSSWPLWAIAAAVAIGAWLSLRSLRAPVSAR
ncbi:MAG: DUF2029 domain-containing protein [Myxococcales bacterium]|nr:DUF2029 domain-containing protein [Myxococcales bacterium]